MTLPQPPLGATPEPSATPRTDAVRIRLKQYTAAEWSHLNPFLMTAEGDHVVPASEMAKLETELATARAALTQCEERAEQNQLALDCLGNLAKLVTNDDGIDPEAFHIELTREEANLIKLVAQQTAYHQPKPEAAPEHRCRHGILAGHCPNCPTMEEIEQAEAEQAARRKGYYSELPPKPSDHAMDNPCSDDFK